MLDESLAIETTNRDSVLGRWASSRWAPATDLALFGLVERIWDFEGALCYGASESFRTAHWN
jgi:hypothetical protein